MSIYLDLKTAIILASGLAIYFYFHPNLPIEYSYIFYGVFGFSYFLDVRITMCNSYLMNYEKNLIFSMLYKKYGMVSPIIQCLIEILMMISLPFFFIMQIIFSDVSVISLVFGISHLMGYFSNRKIIRTITR